MYDIGQGSNIRERPKVFEIDVPDTCLDCGNYHKLIKEEKPIQIPLGKFNSYDIDSSENFTDYTQHTKAGEPPELALVVGGCAILVALAILAYYTLGTKK